jgi:Kef-type K+ transport system membrane component KefB
LDFAAAVILQIIAESRSNEAFVALCLLTVGGSGLLTKMLGLSDTLGAFIAGVLLAETSFRTQVSVRAAACLIT